jgi:hypothetical protein
MQSTFQNIKPNLMNISHQLQKNILQSSLIGAGLPLIYILFIIYFKEDLFEKWMLTPLILIPLGGALGGIFFFLMGFHWFPNGRKKLLALIFSTIIYFVCLWLSAVLAFNFTGHWD